jgi:putative transposase
MRSQGLPETITIDHSGRSTAAIPRDHGAHTTAIMLRPCTSLNTIVEHDHRAVKRKITPMVGFTSVGAARGTIAGIEVMPAIRKGQLAHTRGESHTPAEQFYSLAA